jgi:hypothetical protein
MMQAPHRQFLAALHDFTDYNITWQALPAELGEIMPAVQRLLPFARPRDASAERSPTIPFEP